METILLILVCLSSIALGLNNNGGAVVKENSYFRCPASPPSGNASVTVNTRSALECVARCSQSERCHGVAVCPEGGAVGDGCGRGQVVCEMRSDVPMGQCPELGNASEADCYYMLKLTGTPEVVETLCQNGGTEIGDKCECPLPYVGETCNRYMRDCREGYEQEISGLMVSGAYRIQPKMSATPFMVFCDFVSSGSTFYFKRTYLSTSQWSNKSWVEAKHSIGANSTDKFNKNDFFIGLDGLHELASQANYTKRVLLLDLSVPIHGVAHYFDFNVGPESSNYTVNYSRFESDYGSVENELNSANGPTVFSTMDHDPNGCAALKGAAGWYNSECTGLSLFADPLYWTINNVSRVMQVVAFGLYRQSGFYGE